MAYVTKLAASVEILWQIHILTAKYKTFIVHSILPTNVQTARDLAKRGAQIIVGCRSRQRGEAAVKEIISTSGNSKVSAKKPSLGIVNMRQLEGGDGGA